MRLCAASATLGLMVLMLSISAAYLWPTMGNLNTARNRRLAAVKARDVTGGKHTNHAGHNNHDNLEKIQKIREALDDYTRHAVGGDEEAAKWRETEKKDARKRTADVHALLEKTRVLAGKNQHLRRELEHQAHGKMSKGVQHQTRKRTEGVQHQTHKRTEGVQKQAHKRTDMLMNPFTRALISPFMKRSEQQSRHLESMHSNEPDHGARTLNKKDNPIGRLMDKVVPLWRTMQARSDGPQHHTKARTVKIDKAEKSWLKAAEKNNKRTMMSVMSDVGGAVKEKEEKRAAVKGEGKKRGSSPAIPQAFAKREEESRVSYRECNLETSRREDCGYFGIDQYECYSRECCWGETEETGIPWCYHSIPTMQPLCNINPTERMECGFYGIRKESCMYEGCCWKPSSESGAPWCFHRERVPVFEGECGLPAISPNVMSRIVGGVEAIPHSWPWMVSLQTGGSHFCGGSLINDQWVISAAHCAPGFSWGGEPSVLVGNHRMADTDESQVSVAITEIITHDQYSDFTFENDVMLLKLAEPVEMNDYVSPVCLAEPGDYTPGRGCYTTGWGTTEFMGTSPENLQQVRVPLMNRTLCNDEEWYDGKIEESMVCAGYEEGGRDSCQGDSGGPLVCYNEESEHWELVGIVSWGEACAYENKPGVYSNVGMLISWVEDTMSEYQ